MSHSISRRQWLAGTLAAPLAAARPKGVLIETHIHLFDPARFPYHPSAVYRPPASTLESYTETVRQSKIDHTVIVHPEPYQDDHRYLEYAFAHEPSKGFFKGTCLFDPVAPDTPARMRELVKRNPGRIVALRIHENRKPGVPPTEAGSAIRDRDMAAPAMKQTWRVVHDLGLAIQMHFIPCHAPSIAVLAREFKDMPVILDHLARAGEGTPAEYEHVLRLAELPRIYMKFSGVGYSSKQGYPFRDVQPLVRRVFQAFGADRMIWGGLGMTAADFEKNVAMFDGMFDFAGEADRAKIRGLTAQKLYGFGA
jgi:predicted TIM-barrel fold metal-dependent hydrolase